MYSDYKEQAESHEKLAQFYYQRKQIELALGESQRALDLDSASLSMRVLRSQIFLLEHKFELAEKEISSAMKLDPVSAEVQNVLGALLIEQRKLSDAKVAIQKTIEIHPKFWKLHQNLGLIYYIEKDFQKAVFEYWLAFKISRSAKAFQGLLLSILSAYPKLSLMLVLIAIFSLIIANNYKSLFSIAFTFIAVGYFWGMGLIQLKSANKIKGYAGLLFGVLVLFLHIWAFLSGIGK